MGVFHGATIRKFLESSQNAVNSSFFATHFLFDEERRQIYENYCLDASDVTRDVNEHVGCKRT